MKWASIRFLLPAVSFLIANPVSSAETTMSPTLYTTPRGVMGNHMHPKGGMMISYRYSRMTMEGNRDKGTSVPITDVLDRFPVAPLNMTTEIHLFGVAYAPSDRLTVMAMMPYIRKEMDHVTRPAMGGVRFTTNADGIGDLSLLTMIRLVDTRGHHAHLGLGAGFPSGSINQRDNTQAMADARLPYSMQIGSGTFDLRPALTYTLRSKRLTYGTQIAGIVRLGRNDNGFSYGDRFDTTAWGALRILETMSLSARLSYQSWQEVEGADPELNPATAQTSRPDLQAGRRLELLFGMNFMTRIGGSNGHQFALEAGFPIAQTLNGPQLEGRWNLHIGWQYMF